MESNVLVTRVDLDENAPRTRAVRLGVRLKFRDLPRVVNDQAKTAPVTIKLILKR